MSIDELVDEALGTNFALDFDLNVDLHEVDVNDIAPPIIKLSDLIYGVTLPDGKCNEMELILKFGKPQGFWN